jgi:nucleotide-binding universal stress UspA family protein
MYQRILVPLNASATADRGLREAIGLAVDQRATLCLLHIVDTISMASDEASVATFEQTLGRLRRTGEDLLAKARRAAEAAGAKAETKLREVTHETTAGAILDEALKAACDLIVMGTHGRRGVSRLAMGSEAELVVRSSKIPVLLVRYEQP